MPNLQIGIRMAVVIIGVALLAATHAAGQGPRDNPDATPAQKLSVRGTTTMTNPYRMVENWPTLRPGQTWGAAIGLLPDDTGGLWMLFRSEPPVNYIDASGQVTKGIGEGMIVTAHGLCMDHDGNLWAGDSGPFRDNPATRGRGFQIHKFSPEGSCC